MKKVKIPTVYAYRQGFIPSNEEIEYAIKNITEDSEENRLAFMKILCIKGLLKPSKNELSQGYQDVMHHQLAITAGVQASLMNVLKRFEPRQFEKKHQEGIVIQKRAKCWNSYSQAYREIVKEALEDFFGEAFAQAYEDQLLKLRTTRTTPTKG